jgi:hypothetical protein
MSNQSNDIGKWFEGKVQDALKEIESERKATFHRYPDTRAARNILPAQPGDFLLAIDGLAILIEAKCSAKYDSLSSGFSSLWPNGEAAFHRMWHRAGLPSWVMFCHYDTGRVDIWNGESIAFARAVGGRFPAMAQLLAQGDIKTIKAAILEAAAVSDYYNYELRTGRDNLLTNT